MRYSIAYWRAEPRSKAVPVGVIVVNEEKKKLGLKYLKAKEVTGLEGLAKKVYPCFPQTIKKDFEEYQTNPRHESYKEVLGEYHGFITQLICNWHQTSFYFSGSKEVKTEGMEGGVEEVVERLFKEKVKEKTGLTLMIFTVTFIYKMLH